MRTKSRRVPWQFTAIEDEAVFRLQCHWRKLDPRKTVLRQFFWPSYMQNRDIFVSSAAVMLRLGLFNSGPPQCVMAFPALAEGVL